MFPVKSLYKRSSLKNYIRYAEDSCSGIVASGGGAVQKREGGGGGEGGG